MMSATEKALRDGVSALELQLDDSAIQKLLDYQALIGKWTQVYNLTAVRNPAEMLTHHLLDSLAIIGPLQRHLANANLTVEASLLDVGSGAGLPGVVIAICCPHVQVTCVDAVAKKVAFIKQASLALKLPNLTGLHARVETIAQPFDVVCSRAFASLADFTDWSQKALSATGVWMAMKGKHPEEERAALTTLIDVFHVEQLQVPGLNAERCLLWMRPTLRRAETIT